MASPESSSSLPLGSVADWVVAVATILAVLVALFKEEALRRMRRPRLAVTIRPGPPDCAKTSLIYDVQRVALTRVSADCYYFRLWVSNNGWSRAEQVQVFAASLSKYMADHLFKPVEGFLPMNLTWSHAQGAPEVYASGISPKMGKHCDLGYIVAPQCRAELGEEHPDVPTDRALLSLALEVKPNTGSHLLPPGRYRLTLQVAAANCEPSEAIVELNITGDWHADERRMFSEGIGVRVIEGGP